MKFTLTTALLLILILISCKETSEVDNTLKENPFAGGSGTNQSDKDGNGAGQDVGSGRINNQTEQSTSTAVVKSESIAIRGHKKTSAKPVERYYPNGTANSVRQGYAPQPNIAGNKLASFAAADMGEAGKITAGENNDLSEWKFWKDIAQQQLESHQRLWTIKPEERAVFSVENEHGIPLIGAKIEIYSSSSPNTPVWTSKSDNTGFAQLFGRTEHTDSTSKITHAVVSFNGKEKKINRPILLYEGVNRVAFDESCEASDAVDIAFVVDATGSMQDEIDFLKKDLLDIIETSASSNKNVDLNLASLFYRCEGNSYVTKHSDFSPDLNKTLDFIKEQNADEGGDEVVAKALDETINQLSWREESRTKLLFIVLDEPPGATPEVIEAMKKAYRQASEKGIKIIPCVASGTSNQFDRRLEYLMRTGAMLTNGTYVFFTNDSGVGNNHTLPIVKSVEVEKLNALLKRIIKSNIEVVNCDPIEQPVASTIENGNNVKSQTQMTVDSLLALHNDSLSILELLPYTKYDTYEAFNENRPLDSIDTVRFLQDYKIDVIEWKAYPNPTMGDVKVEINKKIDALHVLDMHGRLLQHHEPKDRRIIDLDFSTYPRGTYIITLYVGEEKLTGRIIKL